MGRRRRRPLLRMNTAKILVIAIPFIWLGLVGGLSFLEAPLKFTAPGITLELGLGIGRLVFYWLNKIELVLAGLFVFGYLVARPRGKFVLAAALIVGIILLLQTLWLLPVLDLRAEAVIAGTASPGSSTHIVYIGLEVIKFILLPAIGAVTARQYINADQ
jgi:hypothetical protein